MDTFLTLYESNATFLATVNQIAVDVAGLGWNYVLKEGQEEDKVESKAINEFIKTAAYGSSFRALLKELLVDFNVCGYCCIEVVRNLGNKISELYRVPAATVRVHKDEKTYVQLRENRKIWFKKFGLKETISSKTGKPIEGNVDVASEMIFFKGVYQQSEDYGIPNIVAAMRDLTGLIESKDYNGAFFRNNGIPNSIITLEGDWEDETTEILQKFLKTEMKGAASAHKTLIF